MRTPGITLLSSVHPQPVQWLWQDRIPLGEITILDGDPGTNKSTIAADIAARVSAGSEMPDGTEGDEGGVLFLVGEDSVEKTLVRRAQAAGADLNRLGVLNGSTAIPADLDRIRVAVDELNAKLIVIDPLMVFLQRNANADQSVRQALGPLSAFAQQANVAVLAIRHLNKAAGRHALYRGSGSIGIVAAARSALLAGNSPTDPNMRVLCSTKSNLAMTASSLLFEPVTTVDGAMRIEWCGECDFSPEDLLGRPNRTNRSKRLDEATYFLLGQLDGDPVEQKLLRATAEDLGIQYRTLERAKEMLGVLSLREGWGPGSRCYWKLPDLQLEDVDDAET
jgi:hypothetical protein